MMFCQSCTKELMEYEGPESVWFAQQWGKSDGSETDWPYMNYTNVDWVKISGDTYTANVRVKVTGNAKNYDRTFSVKVDPANTTAIAGTEYDALPERITVPAGALQAYIPIVLHRTARLETEVVTLGIQLVATDDLSLGFRVFRQPPGMAGSAVGVEIPTGYDASRHTLNLQDILVKPAQWYGNYNQFDGGQFAEMNPLGEFSPKKFRLLCQVVDGLEYSMFMSSETMTLGMMAIYGQRLSNYLMEQYQARQAVVEDDGRLMWAGNCPWKTYQGKAWDGVYLSYPEAGIIF